MSSKIVFKAVMTERGDDFVKFRFYPLNGNCDADLLRKVFNMYIERPLLNPIRTGRGFLFGDINALTTQNFNYGVEESNNSLCLHLYSTLLRNRKVDESEVNNVESYLYIGNMIFKVSGIGYTGIMAVFVLETLIKCIDGMEQEVDENYFEPNCNTCIYRTSNVKDLIKISIDFERYYEGSIERIKSDCVFCNKEECAYYEHEDGASYQEATEVIKDIFDIDE